MTDMQHDLFSNGPNAGRFADTQDRMCSFSSFVQADEDRTPAEAAVRFIETLAVPEGPNAG